MNVLTHLVISPPTPMWRIGNFLGDFVRGRPEDTGFPPTVRSGIRMHRRVDAFTDAHPATRACKRMLRPEHRRHAGIVLDVAFDHALMTRWAVGCPTPMADTLRDIHACLRHPPIALPPSAHALATHLGNGAGLEAYADRAHIARVVCGLAGRLRRPAPLDAILDEIWTHWDPMLGQWESLMADITREVAAFASRHQA